MAVTDAYIEITYHARSTGNTRILGSSSSTPYDTSWVSYAELGDGTIINVNTSPYYQFSSIGDHVIRYYHNGNKADLNYPEIHEIPSMTFHDCNDIVAVRVVHGDPDYNINQFGNSAFESCDSLSAVTLPEGFRRLQHGVFELCGALNCITFPASMSVSVSQYLPNNMGTNTFRNSGVETIFAKGMTAPVITSNTFTDIETGGTLYYPAGADYTTWLNALSEYNWNWATYNPYLAETCDCDSDGSGVVIIESGTTIPASGSPYIYLSGSPYMTLDAEGSCKTLPINAVNCDYSGYTASIDYNPNLTAHSIASVTYENGGIKFCLTSNPLSSYTEVAIVTLTLYDTSGNTYLYYCGLNQEGQTPTPPQPDPSVRFSISSNTIGSGAQTTTTVASVGPDTVCCNFSAALANTSAKVYLYPSGEGPIGTVPPPSPSALTLASGQSAQISFPVPTNYTGDMRKIVYTFSVNEEVNCVECGGSDDHHSYNITYEVIQHASGETPTPSASIGFRDSAVTVAANISAITSTYLTVCGCTVDMNRLFEIVSISGDLPLSAHSYYDTTPPRPRFITTFNPGSTQRSSTVVCRFYDTSGNSYTDEIIINQRAERWIEFDPLNIPISSSAQTVCTNILVNNFGEPYEIEFRNSGMTGFTEFPTPVLNNNTLCMDIPENQSDSGRTLRFQYGISGTNYVTRFAYVRQSGASAEKNIALDPLVINASSADTSGYTTIMTSGCSFSSYTITNRGGQQYTIGDPVVVGNQMRFTFPANTGSSRSETFSMQLFDTEGNSYNTFLVVSQEAKGTSGNVPDPWSDTGDTAYTWYKDDSLLRVLPPTKILADTEVTAYWPVTAHTFNDVGVRASGDVVFTYELLADGSPEYNSHSLYAYTEDNTGTTQQVSTIKLVAFSGTSAYSASTVLMKNPDSHGWITASPNPVNAASLQNSVNVYLTLTNCQRNINKEATDNVEFDEATWVTVTRVNNTTLTFNFQANSSPQLRSTYYYAYGLDTSGNNVYCRIDLIQEGNNMGISITPDRTSLGKPAGSFTARVESTESGNFSFSASSWMVITSYVPESQYGGTLYIDYYENNNEWPRTGDIIATQQISTAPYTLSAKTQISQTNTADTAYIRVTPSSISVDRTAGVVEAQVSYGGLATLPEIVQNDGNMSIISYDLDSNLITVAYGANDTSMDKYKNFTVTAMSTNGNVIAATFSINQGGTGLPVAPIWRDYVLTLPTPGQGYINYNVSYDGTIVYTGRAYGMGQDNIELFYNHICKPFLSNHIDFTEGYQSIREWLGNFIITSPELGDITSVSFFEDYSYENREIQNVMSLNNPITNEVVEGSYVPFSFFITGATGNVTIRQNGQQLTGLTINDNEQHRYFVEAETGKTYSCQGVNYRTIKSCESRYSLYYVNSYGGVDVLPFRGKSFKKTDNITRLNYSRSFRNNTLEFENVNYMNEIKPVWELNTHYMVDEQSRKMHELVESTTVYLYDALEQTYTPVVMTDKKLEYKTYFNQGRKFYAYTINVEESQSKERR